MVTNCTEVPYDSVVRTYCPNIDNAREYSHIITKWITKNKFFVIVNKMLYIFGIFDTPKLLKKIKFVRMFCHAKIMDADVVEREKMVLISNFDGVLQIKTRNFYAHYQIFFLDAPLTFIKKDWLQKKIIYAIIESSSKTCSYNYLQKQYSLLVINIEEGLLFTVYTFDTFYFNKNLVCFLKNKSTIMIIEKNSLLFFNFGWETKKIRKSKICHSSEISFVEYSGDFLILLDKKGQMFLFQEERDKTHASEYEFLIPDFLIKKIKIVFFSHSIQKAIINRKNSILFNFFQKSELVELNFMSKKKKIVSLLKKEAHSCDTISQNEDKHILIASSKFSLFLLKNNKRWKISYFHSFRSYQPTNIASFFNNQKIYRVILFPWLLSSNEKFLITGIGNFIELIDFTKNHSKKKKIKFSKNLKIKNARSNSIRCIEFFPDIFCKKFFISTNSSCYQTLSKRLFCREGYETQISDEIFQTTTYGSRFFQLTIDLFGKNIGLITFNGEIKLWKTSPFDAYSRKSTKILKLKKKNSGLICLSNDGSLLGIIIINIITIWKIGNETVKVQSFNLNFKKNILSVKYFEVGNTKNFLLYSSDEFGIFNIDKNCLIYKTRLTVNSIDVDKWSQRFILLTRGFCPKERERIQIFSIFIGNSVFPEVIFKPQMISDKPILNVCFSCFLGKNRNSCVMIDSLLNFFKIFL